MPYEPHAVGLWVITKHAILIMYFINGKIDENAGHRTVCTGVFSELNLRARFPTYLNYFLVFNRARLVLSLE